jgi:hypothetical protein
MWHDEAWIVGDRPALVALRDVIDAALSSEQRFAATTMMVSDGEAYSVVVIAADRKTLETLHLPYIYEPASDDGDDTKLWPQKLLKTGQAL